jgi:hypothetical protein
VSARRCHKMATGRYLHVITARNRCSRNPRCCVAPRALVTHKQAACSCLVSVPLARCFTESSKRFQREVFFESEQCSWIGYVRTSTAFATGVSGGLATSRVSRGGWKICYRGLDPLLTSFFTGEHTP